MRDVLKDVLLPWYNAYRFFIQNVLRLQKVGGGVPSRWVELGLLKSMGGAQSHCGGGRGHW